MIEGAVLVNATNTNFETQIQRQIALLNEGKPLEAFDQFFDAAGVMYANGEMFAASAQEGRRKQAPYINAAASIEGNITDLNILAPKEVCVFRNQSSFVTGDGVKHQIDGLCWQRWRNGKIIEEQYFDGEHMNARLTQGVLDQPELLLSGGLLK